MKKQPTVWMALAAVSAPLSALAAAQDLPSTPPTAVAVAAAAAASSPATAEGATPVASATTPRIIVTGDRIPGSTQVLSTSDVASWLDDSPGVSTYSAGGVSGLPVLRGLADDRIKVRVDGVEATAACGNHMNPPLSYVAPQQIRQATVMAGVTPVTEGGDSIAGVIEVRTAQPLFAEPGQSGLLTTGNVFFQTRSVDQGRTGGASATVAGQQWSLNYSGTYSQADSYKDGDGDKVLDTLYKSINQSLTLGLRSEAGDQRLTVKLGQQRIPYQGFANQYMDMTDNRSNLADIAYEGDEDWGHVLANVYWQNTTHEMGFFSDERSGTMPMDTHGRNAGYRVQVDWPVAEGSLRVGQEYHRYRLDDWWPPVTGSMMMAPNTYVNINNGRRDRWALYGEWEGPVAPGWSLLGGLRYEAVRMNTGDVQGYGCSMMCSADTAAATTFNAADHSRSDGNIDATLSAQHTLDMHTTLELGLAHKTRSPNLYERYTWGRSTMGMTMTGWFGDGNGYVGNLDLKPEQANTLSAALEWHDPTQREWSLRVEPFYTYVHDFIDADALGTFNPYSNTAVTGALLKFANHDAELWGVNLSGHALLARDADWGEFDLKGKFDWTQGHRMDGGNLYHIMPPTLRLSLTQSVGAWTNEVSWQGVAPKKRVDARRLELQTGGYGLLDLSTRYQLLKQASVQLAVRNLFDKQYALPLGGMNLAALNNGASTLDTLPGQGRSIDVGLNLSF
jgi:iron complex outermembrane recepter protein